MAYILYLLGAFLLRALHIDISKGVLPDYVSTLPFIGHQGFVCPLCGGTRAFVLASTLSIQTSFHYSMFGTCISLWLLLTLPVRVLFFLYPTKQTFKKSYFLIKTIENPDLLMILMAFFLWLQLSFHYCFDYYWIPLTQLK
ncbi:MAG: DUF2752 domain-containing protein [Victivallales bacterium]|nr:DUF2752 domain-containing protein [Victivallales bacterium]